MTALALFIALAPLTLIYALVAVCTTTVLLVRRPWLVWPIMAAFVPVAAATPAGPVTLLEIALAAALLLWLCEGARRQTLRLRADPMAVCVLIYIAVQSVALNNAADLVEGVKEVVKWLEFALILWVASAMLDADQRRWLVVGLIGGALFQSGLGLYQFVFRIGPQWFTLPNGWMRASGTFGQPNPYGGYLGLSLPVLISLLLWQGRTLFYQRRQPSAHTAARWVLAGRTLLLAAGSASVAAALIASWSRGAFLGAAVAISVVLLLWGSRSRNGALLIGWLLTTGLLLGITLSERLPASISARFEGFALYFNMDRVLELPVTDQNFSIVERIAHWAAARNMWESAPWFGIGPGNYATVYALFREPRWEEALGHAHNIYLNTLAETGVFGFIAYIAMWAVIAVSLLRSAQRRRQNGWHRALTIGVLGIIAHLTVHNLFDNLLVQGLHVHVALWLVCAQAPAHELSQHHLPAQ